MKTKKVGPKEPRDRFKENCFTAGFKAMKIKREATLDACKKRAKKEYADSFKVGYRGVFLFRRAMWAGVRRNKERYTDAMRAIDNLFFLREIRISRAEKRIARVLSK